MAAAWKRSAESRPPLSCEPSIGCPPRRRRHRTTSESAPDLVTSRSPIWLRGEPGAFLRLQPRPSPWHCRWRASSCDRLARHNMDAMILQYRFIDGGRDDGQNACAGPSGWRAREEGEAGSRSRPHSTSNPVSFKPTRPCTSFACIEGAQQQRQQLGRNHFVATMAQWKHIGLHGHSVGTFTGECFLCWKNEARRHDE